MAQPAMLVRPIVNSRSGAVEYHSAPYSISTDPEQLDLERIIAFLRDEAYWSRGLESEAVLRSLRHSICFGLYEAGQQLGFARVVSDRSRFAYLGDVFVLGPYRGRGLGKWLVACVLAHPELQTLSSWYLSTADAHSLYTRFGFRPSDRPGDILIFRPGRGPDSRSPMPGAAGAGSSGQTSQ